MKKYNSLLEYAKENKPGRLKEEQFEHPLYGYTDSLNNVELNDADKGISYYLGYINDNNIRYAFEYGICDWDGFKEIEYIECEKAKKPYEEVDLDKFDAENLHKLKERCNEELSKIKFTDYDEWCKYAKKEKYWYVEKFDKELDEFLEDEFISRRERYEIIDIGYIDQCLEENDIDNADIIKQQLMESNFGLMQLDW